MGQTQRSSSSSQRDVQKENMTEVLTMAGMMILSTTTVLAVLWGIVEKDREYVRNKDAVALEKGHEIKHRRTHEH